MRRTLMLTVASLAISAPLVLSAAGEGEARSATIAALESGEIQWAGASIGPQMHFFWDTGAAAADAYQEDGYDDWRLPTIDEVAAMADAGLWTGPTGTLRYWTAESRGNKAWSYAVHSDSSGGFIADVRLDLKASGFFVWPVRTADEPPPPPPPALLWTADGVHSVTWDEAAAAADAHEEEGHDDWRLPTIEELQAGIAAGSFTTHADSTVSLYSDERKGNWVWVVHMTTDAEGVPIPEESGEARKIWAPTSLVDAKFVRP